MGAVSYMKPRRRASQSSARYSAETPNVHEFSQWRSVFAQALTGDFMYMLKSRKRLHRVYCASASKLSFSVGFQATPKVKESGRCIVPRSLEFCMAASVGDMAASMGFLPSWAS